MAIVGVIVCVYVGVIVCLCGCDSGCVCGCDNGCVCVYVGVCLVGGWVSYCPSGQFLQLLLLHLTFKTA